MKSTETGIRAVAEALSGFETALSIGDNLFLNIDQASFTYNTSTWSPELVRVTTNPVSGSDSMLSPVNVTFNLTDRAPTPACASWSRTNSSQTITMASGVANKSILHSRGILVVTTSSNHGLLVGDTVAISGSTNFDGTYTIDKIPNELQYQVYLSGSTATPGDAGRTVAPSSSYLNPFAVSQGIPLGTVSASDTFSLRFNVYSTSSSGLNGLTAKIDWYNAHGKLLATTSNIDPVASSPSTSDWNSASATSISPPTVTVTKGGTSTTYSNARFAVLSLISASGSGTFTLYLDKFQFNRGSVIAYQEPRTVTAVVKAPLEGGLIDKRIRATFLPRVKENVRLNTSLGTPSRSFIAPVIVTKSNGLPTNITHGTAVDITFYGVSDAAPLTWSCTIPGLTSGTDYTFVTATDAETGEKYGHLTSTGLDAGEYAPLVTVTDNNGISTTKRFYLKIL
jgi:hypothetical protein